MKDDAYKLEQKEIMETQLQISRIRKEAFRNDFLKFRLYYFAHYHKAEDGTFQRDLSGLLSALPYSRGSNIAVAAPRGHAKSTLVSLQYILYCICYKLENFIVIISSTSAQAAGFLDSIKCELESNSKLILDFSDVCEIGKKPGPPRWTQEEIITRNGVKVLTLGVGQQIRGRRNKESRPSLIVLDDIENDETADNPQRYEKLERWLTTSVLKAGDKNTNTIFVGTIHHYHSVLSKATSPGAFAGWRKKIYRAVISWSKHAKLWEVWSKVYNQLEEYRDKTGPGAARLFFKANKANMLKGTKVLWPRQLSYYGLMEMREKDGYMSFDSEMQNQPVNPKDCFFNIEEFCFWDDKFKSEEELLNVLGKNAEFYGSCDPSLGRQNKHGDFSAIISVVRDSERGTIYVLDADIERRLPDKTINNILAYHQRRNYLNFAFEANQFQEFMADELVKRGNAIGIYLPVEKVNHTSDKLTRIQCLQPFIKSGTIQFSKRHILLLEQAKYFPKYSHDDGLDGLEMAVSVCKNFGYGKHEIYAIDRKDVYPEYYSGSDIGDREFLEFDDDGGPSPNAREIRVL